MKMATDQDYITFFWGDFSCSFDKSSGRLLHINSPAMTFASGGLTIDVGCNGRFSPGVLEFHSLDNANTWELPPVVPCKGNMEPWCFKGYEESEDCVTMKYETDSLGMDVFYSMEDEVIKVSTKVTNLVAVPALINGVAFILADAETNRDTVFEFPANVPHNLFGISDLEEDGTVRAGLVNPLIHSYSKGNHMNLIFIDNEEKWGTGLFTDGKGMLNYVNLAAAEDILNCGESLYCGELCIQLTGKADPYEAVRKLYSQRGWYPPDDGLSEGVLYSCHPHGTMDSNFPFRRTMAEYAEGLADLKDMGIDYVWLLPIFDHGDRGVYHPTDQSIIDKKYGGDEAVRYFCEKAHEMNMKVLFDYVPHGPSPDDPLALEHKDWCSVDREGKLQIEWNCVSFDMANPEYQKYMLDLVKDHIDRFDIDGSRIDCAMGGLSNWRPYTGNRPSSSNLKGGVLISEAVRDAFIKKGKRPFVTPENFNPVPLYCACTDAFYDMAFYRVLVELEAAKLDACEYTCRLTHWLNAELLTTPKGYNKLRFLGNHDTVTWVWQKARAVKVYGEAKAKALWALIAFIDGIPMIYQGDEDPSIYKGTGPVLREFFKELFAVRKKWLGNQYDIKYIFTGSPIMAFFRTSKDNKRLVLINFSPEEESCTIDVEAGYSVFGRCRLQGNRFVLTGYAFDIIDIETVGEEAKSI